MWALLFQYQLLEGERLQFWELSWGCPGRGWSKEVQPTNPTAVPCEQPPLYFRNCPHSLILSLSLGRIKQLLVWALIDLYWQHQQTRHLSTFYRRESAICRAKDRLKQSKIPVHFKSLWNSADIKQKEDLKPGVPRCSLLFGRYLQINMDKNC